MAFTFGDISVILSLCMGCLCVDWTRAGKANIIVETKGARKIQNEGKHLVLECQFRPHGEKFDWFTNLVTWSKSQMGEKTQISTNGQVVPLFQRRFSIASQKDNELGSHNLQLTIMGLTREDSGNYTCDITGKNSKMLGSVTHNVFVTAPVNNMFMTSGNESSAPSRPFTQLTYSELEIGMIRCVAQGGYPPPEMKMFIGHHEIHSLRRHYDVDINVNLKRSPRLRGDSGMRIIKYTSELDVSIKYPRPEWDGKNLTCQASTHGFPSHTVSALLNVNYAPILRCEDENVPLGAKSVSLRCIVDGKPRPQQLYWIVDDNSTMITDGIIKDERWTTVMDREDGQMETSLYIKRTRIDSFRVYTIVAENEVGVSTRAVALTRKKVPESEKQTVNIRNIQNHNYNDRPVPGYHTSNTPSIHSSVLNILYSILIYTILICIS